MSFAHKVRRAADLGRRCAAVLWQNKSLLVLPLISGAAMIVIMLGFLMPILVSPEFRKVLDGGTPETEFVDYAYGFAFYFLAYLVVVFFNVALIHCVLSRLGGGSASVGDGLALAVRRLPQIIAWALVSATIGLVLNILRDRAGMAGRVVAGLAGLGWTVATYFVVPILAHEGLGPIAALRRSAATLRRTWGEALVAQFGLGVLVIVPGIVAVLLAGLVGSTLPASVAGPVFAILAALMALVVFAVQTLGVVLNAAIYQYATTGRAPADFDGATLAGMFAPRSGAER